MRCYANVSEHSIQLRSRWSPLEPRCLRKAKRDGLCLQHHTALHTNVRLRPGDLERILEMPARD